MVFQERKLDKGYSYDVEDVFGKIHMESEVKLDGDTLDGVVLLLMKQNIKAEKIEGEVKHDKGVVKYKFFKTPAWGGDDEDDKICENIHTSTKSRVKGFILMYLLKIPILKRLPRFVGAFQEAWKKSRNK